MNETINAIVMIDTIENIRKAKSILKQLDSMRRQVLIDVKLVEIQKDHIKELGPAFSNAKLSFGEFKELATSKTTMILNTLIETGKGTVLASPRIRVLDKEEAEINVGDKIPIEITTSSRTAGGDNIDLNKSVQWENVGIKLKIECKKIHDNDDVTIKLYNEVSSVVSYTTGGYPHIRTRNANTTLRLTDGVTVAFGGLINSTEEKKSNDIPFLSKLPGIGKIFQDIRHSDVKTEIVMFITPRLRAEEIAEISENKPNKSFIEKTNDLTGCSRNKVSDIKIIKENNIKIETVEEDDKKSLSNMRALLKRLKRNGK
jgi:type II secretory pathway component GspD/PulD (secretin)